ncbi:MAG: hypothetical protein R2713_00150 [Ilumatobacteraceae bacterium]
MRAAIDPRWPPARGVRDVPDPPAAPPSRPHSRRSPSRFTVTGASGVVEAAVPVRGTFTPVEARPRARHSRLAPASRRNGSVRWAPGR